MRDELKDKRIVVLMGGISSEREISIKSGTAVLATLSEEGYNVTSLDARRDVVSRLIALHPDVVFIALHGGWGENGAIQGLLDILEIPYSGSGVLASALAMDKHTSKIMFTSHGVDVTPYKVIDRANVVGDLIVQEPQWPMPWIIKPNAEGSSVGISIVRSTPQYAEAIDQAFQFGNKVLVERFIKGKEIQVGILGNRPIGCVEVRPCGEFYDYTAKYTVGQTRYILPPEISQETSYMVTEAAIRAFNALSCSGYARVDTILSEDGEVYVLEVNTLPGMTATSLLPKIARSAGVSFLGLIEEILALAIEAKYPTTRVVA
ncbi:MAG: D-alanine--D-alanine ligase [Nitrospirae bacterium]|nr:D-alanine--D-alanine ligase [Nitrospirota bacterium]